MRPTTAPSSSTSKSSSSHSPERRDAGARLRISPAIARPELMPFEDQEPARAGLGPGQRALWLRPQPSDDRVLRRSRDIRPCCASRERASSGASWWVYVLLPFLLPN